MEIESSYTALLDSETFLLPNSLSPYSKKGRFSLAIQFFVIHARRKKKSDFTFIKKN